MMKRTIGLDAGSVSVKFAVLDSEGNIIYRSHWVGDWTEEAYQLSKISNSGNTLEYVFDHDKYPKEVDPKHIYYRKYTRK